MSGKRKKTTSKPKTPIVVYIGIGVIAVLVVAVLIQIGRPDTSDNISLGEVLPENVSSGVTEDGIAYLGSQDARVNITLYEDLACHNCKSFYTDTEDEFIRKYVAGGDVVLYIYPVAFVNAQSVPAAEAFECALDQGKNWEYRRLLFLNQGILPFTRDNLISFAETAGLDKSEFSSCYDQGKFATMVRSRTVEAQSSGVNGTPTFDVEGNLYEGVLPLTSNNPEIPGLTQIIDPLLQ